MVFFKFLLFWDRLKDNVQIVHLVELKVGYPQGLPRHNGRTD